MGIIDKLFPRKGQEDVGKEKDSSSKEDKEIKAKEKEQVKEKTEDYLDLKGFDFKHPVKSLRGHIQLVKEGIYKGDKKAWHQFLMITMVSLAGFCVIATMCINFCFDLIALRSQLSDEHTAKVIQQSKSSFYVQEKLPAGEYGMINIFQSASFHKSEEENKGNLVIMIADCKGGAVIAAAVPNGVEIPKDWLGADSYNLVVDNDGNWSFQQSADYEQRKEIMEKARQEYMERMMGARPPEGAQVTPSGEEGNSQSK